MQVAFERSKSLSSVASHLRVLQVVFEQGHIWFLFIDRIPNFLVPIPSNSYLFCLFTPILDVFPVTDRLQVRDGK